MQIQLKIGENYYTAEYDMGSQDYTIIGPAEPGYNTKVEDISTRVVSKEDYGANSTSITVDEVYNQLVLTCDQEDLETIVDSPTEEEQLTSPYANKMLWAKEFVAAGEGEDALNGCFDMIETESTKYDAATIYEHYIRLKKSNIWEFNGDQYIGGQYDQDYIMRRARAGSGLAFLCSMGNVERMPDIKDNAVHNDIKLSDYLIITVNGNGVDASEEKRISSGSLVKTYHRWPSDDAIKSAQPVARYKGNLSSANLSPADDTQTNYIVIKGEFTNVPARHCSMHSNRKNFFEIWEYPDETQGSVDGAPVYTSTPLEGNPYDWPTLKREVEADRGGLWTKLWHKTKPISQNGDGAYYFVKFYNQYGSPRNVANQESIYPLNTKWDRYADLRYSYSAQGDETDRIHKLNMLCCRLSVGDKYCVEIFHNNAPSTYEWRTYSQCPIDEYQGERVVRDYFYLGPNPAIDDYIIDMSKSWKIANNITSNMGLEGEGLAIPVKKSDNLNGPVKFEILGAVNGLWKEVIRIHPSFWRHTRWEEETRAILANTQYILLKDLTIEIQSDNGGNEAIEEEKDLIYQTVENTKYISKMDDLTFELATLLTVEEAKEKGVNTLPKTNAPYVGEEALRSLYNTVTHNTGKAEELYLTDYYREYCTPQTLVETTLQGLLPWTSRYNWPEVGNTWTTGYDYQVKKAKTNIRTKHIEDNI